MAEEPDEKKSEGDEVADSGPKKHKKTLLVVLVGLLLVGLSVGGTLTVLSFFGEPEMSSAEEEAAAESEELTSLPQRAIYYPIKPPIIVSFDARGRQRMMQVEITLLAREEDVISAIELHMPAIRNELVMLFSGQTYDEVQSPEGRELMRLAALQALQNLLQGEIDKPGVEQLLFTNIVVQ